jgi:hypothetical protein
MGNTKKMSRITVIPEVTDYHIHETERGTEIIISDSTGDKTEIILKDFRLPKKKSQEFTVKGGTKDVLGYN